MTPTIVEATAIVATNAETTATNVDLSLLDAWIKKDDEQKAEDDPFRMVRKTQLEKLTSRDAFDARLHTFRPLNYFCKPTSVSPIVCARFGWTNTSLDMLKCVSCKAALVVTINPKIQKRVTREKLIRAYQSKLATAHKELCPFRFDAELYLVKASQKRKEEVTDSDEDDNSDDDNSQPSKSDESLPRENVVPPYFASILPRDVWEMIEHPAPLSHVQARFQLLLKFIVEQDTTADNAHDGAPPQLQFPPLSLAEDILAFDASDSCADSQNSAVNDTNATSPSRKNRLLSRLAFDPKRPGTALGWEHETLLTRLEAVLQPATEEDEIRAQTRNQGAWEDLHEGFTALAVFGWTPKEDVAAPLHPSATNKSDDSKHETKGLGAVSLECSVCLASLNFNMQQYDQHHRRSSRKAKPLNDDDDAPPSKRRRLREHSRGADTLNPLTSHRYHCPYVCGFPRDGERKGTPIWQTIALKLLFNKHVASDTLDGDDGGGDAATDRLLQLLQSGVSSHNRRKAASANDEFVY